MSDLPNVSSLIQGVSRRLRMSAIGRAFYGSFLWLSGLFLIALLVSRLTGLIPGAWMTWQTFVAVPALAAVLSFLLHRKPSASDSARKIDLHAESKDLFLTVARLSASAGGYQDLVKRDAEQRSQEIQPARVVPYRWERRVARVMVASAVLVLTLLFIPQLDPFGQVEAAEAATKAVDLLRKSQKATIARAERLKKDDSAEGDAEAENELKKLTTALQKMRPGKTNKGKQAKILIDQKVNISKQFDLKNTKQLREMLSKQVASQNFGGQASQKAKEWMKELKEGKSDKLLSEISDLQNELKQLARTKDPVERARKARELKKRMQDLANFASDKANSKELAQALERALEQMEAGRRNEEISEEAMQAAMESLELSKMETENLAQAAKELQQLQEALKAIQMARQLNDQERLDGSDMEGVSSIEDYAEMYRQMMGEEEGGPGGNGEGQGEGGPPAEEDDSTQTGFKKEESRQKLQAGKNLLSWKTKGMSEAGEFRKELANSIRTVKQGVSEAIKKEEVPPGYVDGIKKYFDNIEDTIDPVESSGTTPPTGDGQK